LEHTDLQAAGAGRDYVTHIEDGLDFLGQNLRRHGGKVLTTTSKKNMQSFFEKVRGAIRKNDSAKQVNLIGRLNPIIRGWANYHRHIVASSAFGKAAMVLWQTLWRWAKRRHSKKSNAWIADRHWHRPGTSRRYFAVMAGSRARRGRAMVAYLIDPGKIPIERHIKVKSNAHPFDPQWRDYFESRKSPKRVKASPAL
jgi:RNA-directed DNA polymerase